MSITATWPNVAVGPANVEGETVEARVMLPEKLLKLETVIVAFASDPGFIMRVPGLAETEKSGAVLKACTASPIEVQ